MSENIFSRSVAGALLLLLLFIPSVSFAAEKVAPKAAPSGKAAEGKKKDGKEAAGKEEAPPEPRTVAEIEKDMKKARAAKDFLRLSGLVKEALETKDPAAYKVVIAQALLGDDRDLELSTFRLLNAIDDPALTNLIYSEASKSPSFKTRIILLGVAGNAAKKKKDTAAFEVLATALRDASRPVVLTAIRWLRDAGDPDHAVPILIEGLKAIEAKKERGRAYNDTLGALKAYTGIENITAAADWRTYWSNRGAGKVVKPSKGMTKAIRPMEFLTRRIDSDRILFIIDVSMSMLVKDPPIEKEVAEGAGKAAAPTGKTTALKPGAATKAKREKKKTLLSQEEQDALPMERQRLYRVKRELMRVIAGLDKGTQFTVLCFNHEAHFIGDSPRLLEANAENKRKATEWVSAMQANGETWTDKAFEEALGKLKEEVDTIFFLSDGAPRKDNKPIPEDKVRAVIRDLNRFVKARIHTFGFVQEGANLRRFLEKVAAENDGKFTALE
jgi:hypothetical protein